MGNLEPLETLPIGITAKGGHTIPRVDSVKILGLLINAKGCKSDQRLVYSDLLPELQTEGADSSKTTSSVLRGFFVSHVNYTAPFFKWSQAGNKLDTLIGAVSQDYSAYHIPLAQ